MFGRSLCRAIAESGLALAALCSGSCATSSTATLKTTDSQAVSGFSTDIVSIDGKEPSVWSTKLEPGRHVVEAVGASSAMGVNADGSAIVAGLVLGPAGVLGAATATWANASHSGRMKACFIARPDHSYEVRTFLEGEMWHIQVIDQATTYDVKSPCKPK